MRIQHNIAALNSYRNLTNNNSAVSKNLEKLSSGYRINRAGDDAAGLAISEKMRAQITGLETAQKNANDGISLVQTAEGALTEVHSMLNRMVELADQSANGTYQDDVDRENLQAEMDALKDEINRIADATNFNGINLLDGSLSATGTSSKANVDLSNLTGNLAGAVATVDAVKGEYEMNTALAQVTQLANGDTLDYTFTITDSNGATQNVTVTFTVANSAAGTANKALVTEDGSIYELGTAGTAAATEISAALVTELSKNSAIKDNFTVTDASQKIHFEAKEAGTLAPSITGVAISSTVAAANGGAPSSVDNSMTVSAKAEDAFDTIDLSKATIYDGTNLDKATFEINGQKFVFVAQNKVDADTLAAMKAAGVEHYVELAGGTIGNNDVAAMAEKISMETGLKVETGTNTAGVWTPGANTTIGLRSNTVGKAGGGLTLQIGDTSDDFNQMTVSVGDMHTAALGISGIDISTQAGAQAAVDKIKAAINTVSSTRGDLGALQNRLEHTINNLSVTTENMTAAESRIRDVDMAEEMMAYTKNNILVQASQAMLAQANQIPQGVLQLLQ
ncbi:flagellin [Zhenpiania hominis]|uniref:Flagellin n=1 Tax=Zhenpiania hominis TaxID=2763644 RepID=A0A923NH74_9FIRM|nr:flagellin [Zhenpiania hominis]MBC6678354.1 flagellin [Zhenpiania hominis]